MASLNVFAPAVQRLFENPSNLVNIAKYSLPIDLLRIHVTCKAFYTVLQKNSACWNDALQRVGLPPCPVMTASGNWSPAAYTNFIFGGGLCDHCGMWTETLPYHFLLRLRACKSACWEAMMWTPARLVTQITEGSGSPVEIALHRMVGAAFPSHFDDHWGVVYKTTDIVKATERFMRAVARIPEHETTSDLVDDWEKRIHAMPLLMKTHDEYSAWLSTSSGG